MIKKILSRLLGYPPDALSFQQGMDFTGLPVCTFYQGERKFNFLLDTGSNSNVIDSSVLEQLEHTPTDTKDEVCGMEGNKKVVQTCMITLSYKDTLYPFGYLICDMEKVFTSIKKETGVTLHGIIGSEFFNKFKYVLDFANLVAYSKL